MNLLKPIEQREQQSLDHPAASRCSRISRLFECFALDQRHDHVGSAVGFEEVEDTHNGRSVVEPLKRARFLEETLAAPGKLLGMIGRDWHNGGAALAKGERSREVLLDSDVAIERASQAR